MCIHLHIDRMTADFCVFVFALLFYESLLVLLLLLLLLCVYVCVQFSVFLNLVVGTKIPLTLEKVSKLKCVASKIFTILRMIHTCNTQLHSFAIEIHLQLKFNFTFLSLSNEQTIKVQQ